VAAARPATPRFGTETPLGPGAAALPVAAYGLMLAANLLSGVTPGALVVVGPIVMGAPIVGAAWRLRALSRADR
jgi:hypothetical protein